MSADEGPQAVRMPLNGSKIKQLHKCPRCERTFPFIGHLKCHFYRVHPEFRLDSNELLNIKQIIPAAEAKSDEGGPIPQSLIVAPKKPSAFSTTFALAGAEPAECPDSPPTIKPDPDTQENLVDDPSDDEESEEEGEVVPRATFKCKDCNKMFTNRQTYNKHCLTAHANVSYFMCSHCEKSFPTSQRLMVHQKAHEANKLPCRECRDHPSKNTGRCTHDRTLICDICNAKFHSYTTWKNHQMKCQVESSEESDRKKQKTEKMTKFQCKICNKGFITSAFLKSHIKTHKEEAFLCTKCPEVYDDEAGLKLHVSTNHKEDIFECTKCDMKFKRKFHLLRHEQGHN